MSRRDFYRNIKILPIPNYWAAVYIFMYLCIYGEKRGFIQFSDSSAGNVSKLLHI